MISVDEIETDTTEEEDGVGNYANCLYVSGESSDRDEFYKAAVDPDGGRLLFRYWAVGLGEEEWEPYFETCIAEDDGTKRAYSWDSNCWLFETVGALSEAFPKLTFNYKVASQGYEPEFLEATYGAGRQVSYRRTKDPREAREWSEWHECEADDWIDRLEE